MKRKLVAILFVMSTCMCLIKHACGHDEARRCRAETTRERTDALQSRFRATVMWPGRAIWRYINPLRGGLFLLDLSGVLPLEIFDYVGVPVSSPTAPPPSRLQKTWARICRFWRRMIARFVRTAAQTRVSKFTVKTVDLVRKLIKPKLWKNFFKGMRAAWMVVRSRSLRQLVGRLVRTAAALHKAGALKALLAVLKPLLALTRFAKWAPWLLKVHLQTRQPLLLSRALA